MCIGGVVDGLQFLIRRHVHMSEVFYWRCYRQRFFSSVGDVL